MRHTSGDEQANEQQQRQRGLEGGGSIAGSLCIDLPTAIARRFSSSVNGSTTIRDSINGRWPPRTLAACSISCARASVMMSPSSVACTECASGTRNGSSWTGNCPGGSRLPKACATNTSAGGGGASTPTAEISGRRSRSKTPPCCALGLGNSHNSEVSGQHDV